MSDEIAPAHPSATIVLLRDGGEGLEVLLVRRSKKLTFHGGAWVFPGGRIDPGDYRDGAEDTFAAARYAAVREVQEEANLEVSPADLSPISRWITPEFLPKRFDTWFFVAPAPGSEVTVDGGEIREFCWTTPLVALARQRSGEIELPPPTFVTITQLSEYRAVDAAIAGVSAVDPPRFAPRICNIEGGACSLYEGDAGWESADAAVSGARHRLWLLESGWRYERPGE